MKYLLVNWKMSYTLISDNRAQKEWQILKHLFTERHPMHQDITEMLHYMKLHTYRIAFVCTWMGLVHILLWENSSFVKSTLLQWIYLNTWKAPFNGLSSYYSKFIPIQTVLANLIYCWVFAFLHLPRMTAWEVGKKKAKKELPQHPQCEQLRYIDVHKTLLTPVKLTASCHSYSSLSLWVCPRNSYNRGSCAQC